MVVSDSRLANLGLERKPASPKILEATGAKNLGVKPMETANQILIEAACGWKKRSPGNWQAKGVTVKNQAETWRSDS